MAILDLDSLKWLAIDISTDLLRMALNVINARNLVDLFDFDQEVFNINVKIIACLQYC